jgi:CIC family chloride channel protein
MDWLLRLDRTTRLVLLSVILGVVGAVAAQVYQWMLQTAQTLLLGTIAGYQVVDVEQTRGMLDAPTTAHPLWWIPVVTTLGGLLTGVIVYALAPEAEGHGTDAAVRAYHVLGGRIRTRVPFVKALTSAITIGSGGSGGREGPTAQIAAGMGSIVANLLRLPEDERRFLVLVGMAAGISAIFKSPLGGAIFGVEILYSTVAFEGRALMYTIIGAAVAYAFTGIHNGWAPLFYFASEPRLARSIDLVWYLILGVAAGAVGAVLPAVFYRVRDLFRRLPVPNHVKPAIGGLVVGLLGMYLPQLLGGGYGWMQLAVNGKLAMGLMLVLAVGKIIAMSFSLGSGGSGGVFAPSMYVGAMLGAGMAGLIDSWTQAGPDPVGFAVVGMAALFAGVARVPIASLIMVAEMTGGYRLIMPTMIAVAVSFLVQAALTRRAKYPCLYEAQVAAPMDSPVHRETFYNHVALMLRERKMRLDDDIVGLEMAERLEQGASVPLAGGGEALYSAVVRPGAPVAGKALRVVAFPAKVLIVSIFRDGETLLPQGDTVLEAGDRLIVAASLAAMDACRPLMEQSP